jgi:hypothetical protein
MDAPRVRLMDVSTPATREQWAKIYRSAPGALPSQSPRWAEAILLSGGYRDVSRLYTFADGKRAVVPLFESTLGMKGITRRWSPPAAWGFGGPVATEPLRAAELGCILQDLDDDEVLQLHLRPNPLEAIGWEAAAGMRWTRLSRRAHALDLREGFHSIWSSRFSATARAHVRKAERSGLDVECGSRMQLIEEFYVLLLRSVQRWAERQNEPLGLALWRFRRRDPVSKFHLIAKALGSACQFWVARLRGEPAAAILVLQEQNAHYTRGAMNEVLAGPTAANALLHRLAIEDACIAGCQTYHMGETGNSRGLAQFKSQFGAVAVPYAEYLCERWPVYALQDRARSVVKRIIGFRDA